MIPSLRSRFNEGFKESSYAEFLADLTARVRCPIEFRVSETLCFFPGPLMQSLVAASQSMVGSLLADSTYRAAADAVVPARFRVAKSEPAPTFVQVDFGLIRDGNRVEGRISGDIAASLIHEIEAVGAPYQAFVLEEHAPRPLAHLPPAIAADMEESQVSIFCARAQTHELLSRMEMTDIVNRRRMRHAHMVNISREIMQQGMRADFAAVDAISRKVLDIVSRARSIHCTTPAGSDFTAGLNPNYRWIKTSGLISPDKWGNLPGGEVFTTPGEVNGVFVIDGVVGDYLCEKYGNLKDTPLTVRIDKNRLVSAESANQQLRDDFWAYTHTDENSDRVGEFAIGTNIQLEKVIGEILQDEKFPGIHIAFGNPYGAHTGADWYSGTHIDVVGTEFDIVVDGVPLMRSGKFLI